MSSKKLVVIAALAATLATANADKISTSSPHDLGKDSSWSAQAGLSTGNIDAFGLKLGIPFGEDIVALVGLNNVEGPFGSDDLGVGGGVLYKLPLELPVETGVRGALNLVDGGDYDVREFVFRGVASGKLAGMEKTCWFAEAGLHRITLEIEILGVRGEATDTKLGAECGLIHNITNTLSAYGSVEHVDSAWVNLGIIYSF